MSLFYKPNIDDSVERFKKIWSREAQDRILVKIDILDNIYFPHYTAMMAMSKAPDYKEMIKMWEKGFLINKNINDDNLPVIYGELGGLIIGGFLGAKIRWGPGGAYSEKLIVDIKNYKDHLNLNMDNNEYYKLHMGYINYLTKVSKGRSGVKEMVAIDGLNFLECVRGGDAYTDIYDFPKEAIEIMDFGSELNIKLIQIQRKLIEKYSGGRFNWYGIWTPGETINLSVDAYGHCSPEVFNNFGKKYIQRMTDEFGGGWLHLHTESMSTMKNLKEYSSLKNLVAIGFDDYGEEKRAINFIDEILEITNDIPLMISLKKEEFLEMIESKTLPGNILYWITGVKTTSEANKLTEITYNYKSKYKIKKN